MKQQTREQPSAWLLRMTSELKRYNDFREDDHKGFYLEEFGRLAAEFGMQLSERGIMACIHDTKREHFGFRPLPEQFRDYVLDAKDKIVTYGRPKGDCSSCEGTGWSPVQDRVKKCECRRIQ
jgi:hypothetical protein